MLKLNDTIKGAIYVFISAFMYATLPILTKLAYLHGLDPSSALFYRYLFAFIFILLYQKLLKRQAVISTSLLAIGQGILLITASLFYFNALKSLSAGIGSIIFFTHPILVALLAIFIYREGLGIKLVTGLLLALTGIVFISGVLGGSVVVAPAGLLLGVLASICYGLFVLAGQTNVAKSSPLSLTATFAMIGVIAIPILFFRDLHFLTDLTWPQVLICLGMALFNTVLSISFFLKGVGKIGASRASLISTLEPVLSIGLAIILLGEVFSRLEAAGIVLIMISIYFAITSYRGVNQPSAAANTGITTSQNTKEQQGTPDI